MLKVLAPLSAVVLLSACSGGDSSTSSSEPGDTSSDTTFVVDEVPASMVAMFEDNDIFSVFAELVALTDLVPLFEADGAITIFIPPDAAFGRLPEGTVDKLKDPANKEVLTRLLSYHLLDGKVTELEIVAGTLVMKSGDEVSVEVGDQLGYLMNIEMNGIPVAVGDLYAGNSVAHIMSDVLVPPGLDLSAL
jgi:uncharacterized surface protein with fasciclin (FAS1) repeats